MFNCLSLMHARHYSPELQPQPQQRGQQDAQQRLVRIRFFLARPWPGIFFQLHCQLADTPRCTAPSPSLQQWNVQSSRFCNVTNYLADANSLNCLRASSPKTYPCARAQNEACGSRACVKGFFEAETPHSEHLKRCKSTNYTSTTCF